MSEFSRETLLNIIETDHVQCGEASALARMALAAMDSSESVELPLDYLQGHKDGLEWAARLAEANHPETGDWLYDDPIELAKAIRKGPDMPPVQPAPVVPDDVLKALQKVARIRLDMDGFDGDRRGIADCLCDAEEALIEVVNRRAAMFNHPEQHLDMVDHSGDVNEKGGDGNSPVIPDGWTCNDKANAALMMLDRIETVDPVDDDRIDGIKRIVRELAAAPHDTPALNSIQSVDTVADRWIPVSERMPESNGVYFGWDGKRVLEVNCFFGGFSANQFIHGEITHWMPLPAAPQEVK
ncbi:Eaa1 [Klebsiella pneumoniae]|nr:MULTISPECIES: DUF551 domain-containing protein [Klebsiella]HBT2292410.1 DUF551 domain-containing protein [Klebsiella pneumoniae subsp. pneumoniae]EKZ9700660.1 DUF551 domain-containing protein [Klebsiella pneumoniae]MBM5758578.1 DUF551 domain-containing protein [Klebsiella pneumoniae]MBS3703361.1 DUF551 domain-containing protein [Klebsiella pneumoniae]MBS3704124.1 DUF551 domain-containing protein [Klebsiella pneumoniae]